MQGCLQNSQSDGIRKSRAFCAPILSPGNLDFARAGHIKIFFTADIVNFYLQTGKQLKSDQARAFRLVCDKAAIPQVLDFLEAEGQESEPLEFSPFCRSLVRGPAPLGRSLGAFFGYIYIQDKSSMLPPLALAPPPGSRVLDMCASPGGKSIFLGQLAGSEGFVLANEPPGARLGTLRANLTRASLPQVASCVHDGQKLPLEDNSWPFILLDAPCSGWGTAEKNPAAPKIWRGKKINPLLGLQRGLLKKAAALLAPGGRLLYSTCTTNEDENEAQTHFAMAELDLELLPLAPFPGFRFAESLPGALRVDGPASGAQGFYLALLQKKAAPENPAAGISARSHRDADRATMAVDTSRCLALPPNGRAELFGATVRYVPQNISLPSSLVWQAYPLGKAPNGEFAPQARLHSFLRPRGQGAPVLQMDATEEIRALLCGSGKNTGLAGTFAALYWRDLPLGFIGLKNGRPIPAFR